MESSNFLTGHFSWARFFLQFVSGVVNMWANDDPKNQRKLKVNFMYNIPTKNSDSPV